MNNSRKLSDDNLVWGAEAARILGISKSTYDNRILMGRYEVSCMRSPMGFKYSIFDVFKIAHPRLNDKQIEEFIMDYRIKTTMKRKSNKKRVVK